LAAAATPQAQAAAWLARLPPSQLAAAHAHTDVRLAAWFGGLALLAVACILLTRARFLPRLAAGIEARGPRPWLTALVTVAALTLTLAALKGVFDAAAGWWGDGVLAAGGGVAAGVGFATRLQAALAGAVTVTVLALVFVPPALWLMRRLPRAWPFVLGGTLAGVMLALGWLPYALAVGPPLPSLPAGPARDALTQLLADARLPAPDILVDPDPGSLTDVTGGLAPPRVVIGADAAGDTPAELKAYVGHLIGHYAHADILIVTLVIAATLLGGALAIRQWAAPLARRMGASGAASPADPSALPAVALIAILTVAAAGPLGGGYLRWANVRADAYALDHAREPDALASVLVQDWDHASVDPDPVEEAIFYTHPPLADRLVHAMQWKAAHGG
jgi:STE24 endopeptidase